MAHGTANIVVDVLIGGLSFVALALLARWASTRPHTPPDDSVLLDHFRVKAYFKDDPWVDDYPIRFCFPTLGTTVVVTESREVRQKTTGYPWRPSTADVASAALLMHDSDFEDRHGRQPL